MKHVLLAAALAAAPLTATADGSGLIDDANLQLSYTSEPYVMANVVTFQTGIPACEEGTPLCDVYTLTVSLSDTLRNDSAKTGYFEFAVNSTGDFDLYIYDSEGALVASSETDGPELLLLDLIDLPNGTYKLWLVPFIAAGDSAVLDVGVFGIKGKSGLAAIFGGAMPPGVLILLLVAALRRRVR